MWPIFVYVCVSPQRRVRMFETMIIVCVCVGNSVSFLLLERLGARASEEA